MTTSLATVLPRVEDQDRLDRVIAEQGGRPGSLLSILEKLQEQHRSKYLPMETLEYVAARTGVPQARVYSVATFYALFNLEPRGRMFVSPGDPVYEGMIIGIHSRDNDLIVNPVKTKKLTNVRAAGKDENTILTPPIKLTLESAIEFIADDELVEITPKSIRIRKRHLKEHDRKRASRDAT